VPRTDDEGLKFPHRYFEFHLRVNRKDGNADDLISPEELSSLLELGRKGIQQIIAAQRAVLGI
jgi:hypothetical protein